MSEEIKKMGISVEEILELITGTSQKETFSHEIDKIIKINNKIKLEYEIKLKLNELKNEIENEKNENESMIKLETLIKKIVKETYISGNFFSKLKY